MPLQFSIDPQTGVVVPPVTVFNGGKRSKRKTRKSKASRKSRKQRKQTRRRR